MRKFLARQRARTTVDLSLHDDNFYLDFGKRVFSLLLRPSELHMFLDKQADIARNENCGDLQPPSPKRKK